MQMRTENIVKSMQSNEDKVASLVSSAYLMIQKKHYASSEIQEVIDCMQNYRGIVKQVRGLFEGISGSGVGRNLIESLSLDVR